MKKLFKRFAALGLVAGALVAGLAVEQRAATACLQPILSPEDPCVCRSVAHSGYLFCAPRAGTLGCNVNGTCTGGGGSGGGGGGEPL